MGYLYLTVPHRKEALQALGLYKGKIDGEKDDAFWQAVLAANKAYLPKDKHKKTYYKATDLVLRSVRALDGVKNFKVDEFKCGCGGAYCTGYPVALDKQLAANLQKVRDKFGPVTITCGLRCQVYNDKLAGSIKNSRHLTGKAADIYIAGVTDTLAGRKKVMAFWKTLPKYGYTYCNENGSHPNMGNAVHVDVL